VSTNASSADGDDGIGEEMLALCRKIDADGNGSISELELITAVRRYPEVAAFVLPDVDRTSLLEDEGSFDAVDELFEAMAAGKQRIRYKHFVAHFRRKEVESTSNVEELKAIYGLIDSDANGSVSKLELYEAVKRHPKVAQLIFLNRGDESSWDEEEKFDATKTVFEAVAAGKKRFDFEDFKAHFAHFDAADLAPLKPEVDRPSKRVLIIGPGFGRQMNPRQGAMIDGAGYQVHWCWEGLPNPEQPNFDVSWDIEEDDLVMAMLPTGV